MRAEKFRSFDADGPKTKTGAFSGAGDYTYVADHKASFVGSRRFQRVVEQRLDFPRLRAAPVIHTAHQDQSPERTHADPEPEARVPHSRTRMYTSPFWFEKLGFCG